MRHAGWRPDVACPSPSVNPELGCSAANQRDSSAASRVIHANGAEGAVYLRATADRNGQPLNCRYGCGGTFLKPAYGAHGVYYRVVPGPDSGKD